MFHSNKWLVGLLSLLTVGALVLAACEVVTNAPIPTPIAIEAGDSLTVGIDEKPAQAAENVGMAVNPMCVYGSSFGFEKVDNYVEFRPNFCAISWDSKVHGPYLEAELVLWNLPDAANNYVARAGLPWPGDGKIPIFGGRLFGKWLPSEFSICTK